MFHLIEATSGINVTKEDSKRTQPAAQARFAHQTLDWRTDGPLIGTGEALSTQYIQLLHSKRAVLTLAYSDDGAVIQRFFWNSEPECTSLAAVTDDTN